MKLINILVVLVFMWLQNTLMGHWEKSSLQKLERQICVSSSLQNFLNTNPGQIDFNCLKIHKSLQKGRYNQNNHVLSFS